MVEAIPSFSIIIPTYNRPKQLYDCLHSLVKLNYPHDLFEVIVVDDGSKLSPELVIKNITKTLDSTPFIRLLTQANSGPAKARNAGARAATRDFLAFTDDDCQTSPDWLQQLAQVFQTHPNCAVGGRTINALPQNPYSTTSQLIVDVVYRYYNSQPNHAHFFASDNLALPTQEFLKIGGFDETFRTSEDRELCDRWLKSGRQMVYAPAAKIDHAHHLSFLSFYRQHVGYGRGSYQFHHQRERINNNAPDKDAFLEKNSFFLELLKHPFLTLNIYQATQVTALIFVSQIASLSGFFIEIFSDKLTNKIKLRL